MSDAESREASRGVLTSGYWGEETRILLDLTGVIASTVPSAGVLRARIDRWITLGPVAPRRMAIVAAPGALFGISRMIEGFTGTLSDRVQTFDDPAAALIWLRQTDAD